MVGLPEASSAGSVGGVGVAFDRLALPPSLLVRVGDRVRVRVRVRLRLRLRLRLRVRLRAGLGLSLGLGLGLWGRLRVRPCRPPCPKAHFTAWVKRSAPQSLPDGRLGR